MRWRSPKCFCYHVKFDVIQQTIKSYTMSPSSLISKSNGFEPSIRVGYLVIQ